MSVVPGKLRVYCFILYREHAEDAWLAQNLQTMLRFLNNAEVTFRDYIELDTFNPAGSGKGNTAIDKDAILDEFIREAQNADLTLLVASAEYRQSQLIFPTSTPTLVAYLARALERLETPRCYIEVDGKERAYNFTTDLDFSYRGIYYQARGANLETVSYFLFQYLEAMKNEGTATFSVRLMEEPLRASSLALSVIALTDLYTRCWLIQKERYADLVEYARTQRFDLVTEANLVLRRITHNSPALLDFLVSSASIAGTATLALALKTAIDAVVQAPLRFRATQLQNQREELEQRLREQEAAQALHLAEQKALSERHEAQQAADLALQKAQLEIERQQMILDLLKQQVALEQELLQIERDRRKEDIQREQALLEKTQTIVTQLQPRLDGSLQNIVTRSLAPALSQLSNHPDVHVVSPAPLSVEQQEDQGKEERYNPQHSEEKENGKRATE
jgi:hypothetical protein